MQVTWSSCAADLRRWNFQVSVAFSRKIYESWNSRIPLSEYDLRRQAYHVTNLEVHFVIWFCCHGYENAPNVKPNNRHGAWCSVYHSWSWHWSGVLGRCPFFIQFYGDRHSQAIPGPILCRIPTYHWAWWNLVQDWTKDVHGKVRLSRWGVWWIGGVAACCVAASVLCVWKASRWMEKSVLSSIFIYIYLAYLALNI